MGYPEEWAQHFEPLPSRRGELGGDILIEREESPETTASGLLYIPPRLLAAVKAPIAVVIRSADPRAQPGDIVLVAEGAGRRLAFGDFKPTVYYLVTYDQLRLRFARVWVEDDYGWRESVSQDESIHRVHLPESILLAREDVADQGLATAIGDQRSQQ